VEVSSQRKTAILARLVELETENNEKQDRASNMRLSACTMEKSLEYLVEVDAYISRDAVFVKIKK
jgi:hypothetical protein